MLRDMPEPTLLRDIGHSRRSLINPRFALGALVIGPHRHLVQIRIALPPTVAHRRKRLPSRAVESHRRPILRSGPILSRRARADHPSAFLDQLRDRGFFPHLDPFFPRVVEKEFIEFRAQHLPGLRHALPVVAIEEVEGLRDLAVRLHERDAIFFNECRCLQFRDHADPFQRLIGERNQRLADVIAWKLLALENQHPPAMLREHGCGAGAPRGSAPDHQHVVIQRSVLRHKIRFKRRSPRLDSSQNAEARGSRPATGEIPGCSARAAAPDPRS